MRSELKKIYESGNTDQVFDANVGFRRAGGIRFASKPSLQKLLINVKLCNEIVADHLIMTVGREIPAVPLIYSRIMPGNEIKFLGKIFKYIRTDKSIDYGIRMLKLLESNQSSRLMVTSNLISLKNDWLNHKITSKQYLQSLCNGRR